MLTWKQGWNLASASTLLRPYYLFTSRTNGTRLSVGARSAFGPLRTIFSTGPKHANLPLQHTEREWCPVIASLWETKKHDDDVFRQNSSPGLLWFPYLPWNLGNHPHPKIDRNELLHLPAIVNMLFHYIVVEDIFVFLTRRHSFLHSTGISLTIQIQLGYIYWNWTCGSQEVCYHLLAG